jgi:hypothetical protein
MTNVQSKKKQQRQVRPARALRKTALDELLVELALPLIQRGITPRRFAELARYAFARAAALASTPQDGKINHSRVAAQTGLSRAEVKRLLENGPLTGRHLDEAPIRRVLKGWQTDAPFANRPGQPNKLKIKGSGACFVRLVRTYGGDVPHRAVLSELRRMGAVSGDDQNLRLRTSYRLRRSHDLAFLSSVLPAVVNGLRIASATDERKGLRHARARAGLVYARRRKSRAA